MNSLKTVVNCFISLCFVASLSGCDYFSSNLSRSKAEALLKQKVAKDIVRELVIGDSGGQLRFICQSTMCQEPFLEKRGDNDAPTLVKLRDAGFITIEKKIWNQRAPGYFSDHISTYTVEPTGKLSQYGKVATRPETCELLCFDRTNKKLLLLKLAELDKITVTGLTEPSDVMGQKLVQAEYTIQYTPTPVSGLFLKPSDLSQKSRAAFVKFDDGWRLDWQGGASKSFDERGGSVTAPLAPVAPTASVSTGAATPPATPAPQSTLGADASTLDPALALSAAKVDASAVTITSGGFAGLKVGHSPQDAKLFFGRDITTLRGCGPDPKWTTYSPQGLAEIKLASNSGRLVAFWLKSDKYLTRSGLKVGLPESRLLELVGNDPSLERKTHFMESASEQQIRYTLGRQSPTSMLIIVKNGQITDLIFGSSREVGNFLLTC